jgi:Spy/CpxP family protein refolding chaperone
MLRLLQPPLRCIVAAACLIVGATVSLAQGRGPGGPPQGGGMGGGMGGPPPGGGMGGPQSPNGGPGPGGGGPPPPGGQGRSSAEGTARPGFQFGPPGRWWDDRGFVKSLKLRPDQQTRMDAIFEQNRPALSSRLQNLQQAESQMEAISASPEPDEAALNAQIDRVAQARAELEKANTHMLLQIRKEMDPDQIVRLESHR